MDFAALERRRLAAIVSVAPRTLEELHHDDFVLCTPSGVVWDRARYLGGLVDGTISYTRFEPTGEIEVVASSDLAALRYPSVIDLAVEGGGGHLECWHLDVYVRGRHGWRCRWSQATDTIVGCGRPIGGRCPQPGPQPLSWVPMTRALLLLGRRSEV